MRGVSVLTKLTLLCVSIFFSAILCAGTVHAASGVTEGWYYAGETFKIGDVLYSVEGESPDLVLLGVGSELYLIRLHDCAYTAEKEYCYEETGYPDEKVKYAAGKALYGYYLSISDVVPALTITRKITPSSPEINQPVEILVTYENVGDYSMTDLRYAENIPPGFRIINPISTGSNVSFKIKSVPMGKLDSFTYTLVPEDFVSGVFLPNVSYLYNSKRYNIAVKSSTITVATPLAVSRSLPATISLGEIVPFDINITNNDEKDEMRATVVFTPPKSIIIKQRDGLVDGPNGTLNTTLVIPSGETVSTGFRFSAVGAGSLSLPTDVYVKMSDSSFRRHYDDKIQSKADAVVPSITLSSERSVYRMGYALTVRGLLRNTNPKTMFSDVKGTLSGQGVFTPETFDYEKIAPSKELVAIEKIVTLPVVENQTSYLLNLSGSVTTPSGDVIPFSAVKTINVKPFKDQVNITRTIEPAKPVAGKNITVTVTVKNIFGEYITFTAFDSYDSQVRRVSGLTYAETSMEKDTTKAVYIYQLEIPANYSRQTLDITTAITVKDELPVELTTSVPVSGVAPGIGAAGGSAVNGSGAGPQTAQNTTNGTSTTTTNSDTKGKMGFFASMWDFLKNIF